MLFSIDFAANGATLEAVCTLGRESGPTKLFLGTTFSISTSGHRNLELYLWDHCFLIVYFVN